MFKKILFMSLIVMTLFSCGKNDEQISKTGKTPAIPKQAWNGTGPNKRFYKVAEKLDRNGDFYLYMDVKDAFTYLTKGMRDILDSSQTPQEMRIIIPGFINSLENLGIFGMEDFGMSVARIDDALQFKTFIRMNDTNTVLFRMLGGSPHDSLALKYAPADALLFHAMDVNLSETLSFVKSLARGENPIIKSRDYNETAQKFKEEFDLSADELIASLGTEFAFFLKLDATQTVKIPDSPLLIHQPQFAFLVPTKQKLLHETITRNLLKNNVATLDTQSDEIKRTRVAIPPFPDFPMSPEIAFDGEYEILCSHGSLMEEILNARKSGSGLSGSAEFQNLAKNLPEKYNGLTFISEKAGREILAQISNAMNMDEVRGRVNAQALADFLKIFLGARMSVRVNDAEGIWIVTRQIAESDSTSLSGLAGAALMSLNSGGAVGVGMILSAIAIPNFLEAQTRAKVSRTKAEMRTLATAIEAYNVDFNSYPSPNMNNRWEAPHCLTTPIAYVISVPGDPFSSETGAKIRYYLKDGVYLLYAAGPDREIDIDPERDFDPRDLQKLKNKTYDPTNGTVSKGDIIRMNR